MLGFYGKYLAGHLELMFSLKTHKKISCKTFHRKTYFVYNFLSRIASLNVGKTKYALFYKPSRVNNLPLQPPKLSINNQEIKRASHTKFLGTLLNENIHGRKLETYWKRNCKKHCINAQPEAKPFIDKDSLLSLYFSDIHSYIGYANSVWASKANFKKDPQPTETCRQDST